MKKILFGVIATVFFGLSANAQKISKEEARVYAAKVLIEFKSGLEPSFKKTMSFEEFIKNTTGPYNPQGKLTNEGRDLLKVTYNYLTKGTSDKEIVSNYNGFEISKAFKYLRDNPSKSESDLFGLSSSTIKNQGGKGGPSINFENVIFYSDNNLGCCFFCLRCHLTTVVGEKAADTIIGILIDALANLFN
jgi:hypothetical protein